MTVPFILLVEFTFFIYRFERIRHNNVSLPQFLIAERENDDLEYDLL